MSACSPHRNTVVQAVVNVFTCFISEEIEAGVRDYMDQNTKEGLLHNEHGEIIKSIRVVL